MDGVRRCFKTRVRSMMDLLATVIFCQGFLATIKTVAKKAPCFPKKSRGVASVLDY